MTAWTVLFSPLLAASFLPASASKFVDSAVGRHFHRYLPPAAVRLRDPGAVFRGAHRAFRLRPASLSHDPRVLEVPQADAYGGPAEASRSCRGSPFSFRSTTNNTWWSGCSRKPARSIIRASCCRSRCWTIRPTRRIRSRERLVAEYQGRRACPSSTSTGPIATATRRARCKTA